MERRLSVDAAVLAVSPWDPALLIRRVAERWRVRSRSRRGCLMTLAFRRKAASPGVKRQYSGTLGKIGNCQIGVSLHAAGSAGTVPLGWALYLPEEWCKDKRDARREDPEDVSCRSVSWAGSECAQPAGRSTKRRCWATARTAITPSFATSCTTAGCTTCCRFAGNDRVHGRDEVHRARAAHRPGRRSTHPRPDTDRESIGQLVSRLGETQLQTVAFRDGPDGTPLTSRFMFVRVRAAHHWRAPTAAA